jgi:hypothetical protein
VHHNFNSNGLLLQPELLETNNSLKGKDVGFIHTQLVQKAQELGLLDILTRLVRDVYEVLLKRLFAGRVNQSHEAHQGLVVVRIKVCVGNLSACARASKQRVFKRTHESLSSLHPKLHIPFFVFFDLSAQISIFFLKEGELVSQPLLCLGVHFLHGLACELTF